MQKYKTAEYLFYYLGYIMIVCCVIWLKDQYKIAGKLATLPIPNINTYNCNAASGAKW